MVRKKSSKRKPLKGKGSKEGDAKHHIHKNNIIALVIPDSKHLFFGDLLYYVEEELFKQGYCLMVCISQGDIEKEKVYLDMLKNNKLDSMILITNNDIEKYLDKNLSIISFDRKFSGISSVASDNYSGGELAAKRLIEAGCKNMMFIGDDAQGYSTPIITEVAKRRKGFINHLTSVGFKDIKSIEYPLGDYLHMSEEVRKVISRFPDIDGIFTISDSIACDVIKELKKNGKKVPEEVKVIGFDGGKSFLNLGKNITSIAQSTELIAKAFIEVIQNYNKTNEKENRLIPVYLVEGDTV